MSGSMDQTQVRPSLDDGALFSQFSAENQGAEQQDAQRVIQDSLRKIRDRNSARSAAVKDFMYKNIMTDAVHLEDSCDCLEFNNVGYPKNGDRLLVKGYPFVFDAQLRIDYSLGLELSFSVTLQDRKHIYYQDADRTLSLSFPDSKLDTRHFLSAGIAAVYDSTVREVEEKINPARVIFEKNHSQ